MHAFDVLGDPVRRQILDLLADGERTAGEIVAAVQGEFGISQPAVSRHLRVLRESGFAASVVHGQQRVYELRPTPLVEVDQWLERYRGFWGQRLDALETEIRRGRRDAGAREKSGVNASAVKPSEHADNTNEA
ncbi:winged helix-turn-helix transcriptional regulator [Phytoactinopolyspora alkaliphila]|uniref:Winged helix-turn-helix transcriptional regulator n=1 Tax=Phytoactinopolyspora alkaliphila TaxID=1783498 RepID=A0A6N9YIC6_9ACTN|nr:metalloregulator ArsR/SmtB family transcription factor [Phytoactinopolyspora alkaliphila]NED94714.1 winged helix-turn-helix transcriptional regulator [Phytoactinopolyspora alkaliphila]